MSDPEIKPVAVVVVEEINCANCKGSGYEPGYEPGCESETGRPVKWCFTCQGVKVRHRAMPLEDFAKLFGFWHPYNGEEPIRVLSGGEE